jgi:hypothetical protein
MKNDPSKAKDHKTSHPFEAVKVGSISIPIYAHTNIIPQRDPQSGAILYDCLADGKRKARVKYMSAIYTVAYYAGTNRMRPKFSDLAKARREAELIAVKLANGETEALN